jgi:hypothetical protein
MFVKGIKGERPVGLLVRRDGKGRVGVNFGLFGPRFANSEAIMDAVRAGFTEIGAIVLAVALPILIADQAVVMEKLSPF